MAGKILIFGATGAVGSSLAKLLSDKSKEIHLIGKTRRKYLNFQKKLVDRLVLLM